MQAAIAFFGISCQTFSNEGAHLQLTLVELSIQKSTAIGKGTAVNFKV